MEYPNYNNETTIKKFGIISTRPPAHLMNDRMIVSNLPDEQVPDNSIRTSKYTVLTFIPMNLFEQFSKLANVYFLVIGVMQMIPAISITNGQPVIFGPLSIVICISMIKDFAEDYSRHRSDTEENNRQTKLIRQGPRDVCWSNLRIGDLIRVAQNEAIPADIVIVKSSDPKGTCFIETKNLDGETNLKTKYLHKDMINLQKSSDAEMEALRISINYEKPNPYLYRFNGSTQINNQSIPLDDKNFILRGCSLRNVQYVYGIVCYNGHDSKIMLNSVKARPKHSHLEMAMNYFIILIFGIQMAMCFTAGAINSSWQQAHNHELSYMDILDTDPEYNFMHNLLLKWGNWILIFTNFVPISLLVSLEMVKYFQGMLITSDPGTYSAEYDIKTSVQSSNLNEELGQVEYIFSDKTGTLTKNQMDYKCATIGGQSYGMNNTMSEQDTNRFPKVTNVDFKDGQLFENLKNPAMAGPIKEFLQCLSLCHTVITEAKDGQILYQASSPDELALINFAKFAGYIYEGQDQANNMIIRFGGQESRYQVLQVLEFNSTRKRMSVILQDPFNQIILYTKGADSVIEKRMKQMDPTLKQRTWQHLSDYANIGLRTLILAKRVIPLGVYQQWAAKYKQACASINNREQLVMDCQDQIEVELELVGGTAIEDKLQEDVGPTISYLKEAGIKVWVLTGDKIETAINIGYSCQLLNDSLKQILVDGVDEQTIHKCLTEGVKQSQTDEKHALIISGDALIIAMKPEYSQLVMQIADKCEAVVACRVSPKQKQEIVSLVRREKPTVTTLAIGDGANDVNMITAAHVGIGIKGVEGQQAARASDYSVGEFRFLRRLTMYHGRESYRKNSHLVTFNFFKNMMLVLPQFWWAVNNGFSAVNLYDPWMYQSYNLFYTALPIVLYAIFDEEFTGDYLVQNPQLYVLGLKSQLFNSRVFVFWVLNGAVQAAVEGLLGFQMIECSDIYGGMMGAFWPTGTAVLSWSIYNGNLKIIMFSNTFTAAIILGLLASVGIYWVMYAIISSSMATADIGYTMPWSWNHWRMYLVTLFMLGATTMIDLAITRWAKFSQYGADAGTQHDKVYLALFKQHVELQEDQQQPNTKMQIVGQPSSERLKHKYTGFAFSQEEK